MRPPLVMLRWTVYTIERFPLTLSLIVSSPSFLFCLSLILFDSIHFDTLLEASYLEAFHVLF